VSIDQAYVGDVPETSTAAGPLGGRAQAILEHRRRTSRRRGWLVRRALASADVLGLLTAFLVAQWLYGSRAGAVDRITPLTEIALFAFTLPGWVVLAKLYGLYDGDEARNDHSTVDDVARIFNMLTAGTWVFFAATWLLEAADPQVPKLVCFWLVGSAVVPLARVLARALCRRSIAYRQNTIIVGAGVVGQSVGRKLLQHPEYGVNVLGFLDDEPRERGHGLSDLSVLGSPGDLRRLAQECDVERVIIAFSRDSHERVLELVRSVDDLDVQVDVVPRLFEALGTHVHVHSAEGLTLLGLPPARLARSALLLKRGVDLVLSALGLLVLAPLFVLAALAIKLDSPGPVFFRQIRMGKDDHSFRIFKFRTMTADADVRKAEVVHLNKHLAGDARMFKIPDDPRVTRVGRFLRRYSLDELPQLLNVLAGDMSLVGPRPLILDEDQHVGGWARRRLNLKPGITGLWQVLGRDDIPFEEMVQLDYRYVTSWSLSKDLKLIAQTLPVLVNQRAA
jgi:exopolysaccharide biosynthesis polyprenyl glycosylphosphotransferase